MVYKSTFGGELLKKEVNVDGNIIELQIWDTSGGEKFYLKWASNFRNSCCCILVFDLTDPKSFESIEKLRIIFSNSLNPKNPDSFPFVLIGNKFDKERKVDPKKIEEYCETKSNMVYFETSSKNNTNVEAAFEEIAKLAFKRYSEEKSHNFFHNKAELKSTNQPKNEIDELKNKIKQIENDKSNLDNEIKKLKKNENENQLIIESYKNENAKLRNIIKQLENDKLNLINEAEKFKKTENENEGIIKDLKNQLNELQKQNQLLNNKIIEKNDNNNEIIELMKNLEKKNDEIKELKSKNIFNLKEGEKLMTVIFISDDQHIHYAFICKNTDKFSSIEELLYEEYTEYKKKDNYFLFNGKRINRFETLEENGIQNSSLITLYKDEYQIN